MPCSKHLARCVISQSLLLCSLFLLSVWCNWRNVPSWAWCFHDRICCLHHIQMYFMNLYLLCQCVCVILIIFHHWRFAGTCSILSPADRHCCRSDKYQGITMSDSIENQARVDRTTQYVVSLSVILFRACFNQLSLNSGQMKYLRNFSPAQLIHASPIAVQIPEYTLHQHTQFHWASAHKKRKLRNNF